MQAKRKLIIVDVSGSNSGHRLSYYNFLAGHLNGVRARISFKIFFYKNCILFPMVEEGLMLYLFFSIGRAIFGLKTVGFFFRPLPTIEGKSVRLTLKRFTFKFLKLFKNIGTLTIVPHYIDARLSEVSSGWIYDPQLWDLNISEIRNWGEKKSEKILEMENMAAGRVVCIALGKQDTDKGFDEFAKAYKEVPNLNNKVLFAYAGKTSADVSESAKSLKAQGAYVCDEYISDKDLFQFYLAANYVWCAYGGNYDQASGILGRAVQFGVTVIVRHGTLMHKFCQKENYPHVVYDKNEPAKAFDNLCDRPISFYSSDILIEKMMKVSLENLRVAGIEF